jgi:hypothetical protein
MEKDNNDLVSFEEEMAKALLIEIYNAKRAEVFENVVFEGKRRYYIEDLSERDYLLENTTPYQIDILQNIIAESSWGELLCKVVSLLLSLYPKHLDALYDFRCEWTKSAMFTNRMKTNYKQIKDDLFINCNHTALHSCWFLQDILDYFKVNKSDVVLLIHRPCSAEPQRVTAYIEKRFKNGFINFLIMNYKKSEEYGNKVVSNIEKYINPILCSISKSYTNIFLFDDNTTLSNYIKKIREKIDLNVRYDEKSKTILYKYLDYLWAYYRE